MFKFSVDTIKMISRDIKLTKPKIKDNKQSLIVIRLVRIYFRKLVIFHGTFSSWGNASDRAVQTYADFYAHLGYSSIQLGLKTSDLKGFNQIFNEQGFWNDAERQIYTEIMVRDTLPVKISDNLTRALKMTDYAKNLCGISIYSL